MSTFVCSDLHLNHKNIISYCRNNFKTIDEHDEYVITQYNSVVHKDDLVYILGDIGFTPYERLKSLIQRLNGRKVLLIGNHDRLTDGEYQSMGFIQVCRHPIYYSTNIILSHIPVQEACNNPWVINLHGHIHGGVLDLPNYFNVNIERYDYKPINMDQFKQYVAQYCRPSRYEAFGHEWYAAWEVHSIESA